MIVVQGWKRRKVVYHCIGFEQSMLGLRRSFAASNLQAAKSEQPTHDDR